MNGIVAREDFNQAVDIFRKTLSEAWGRQFTAEEVIKEFKLTQSELRLEQPLTANLNRYNFPIMDNQTGPGGQIFNTEIRLRMQDTFVPVAVAVRLSNPGSLIAGAYRLFTYPNQFNFANAIQMRALYNGTIQIMVNNYEFTYGWGLQRHWCSNQTQQTAAFGAGSPEDQNNMAVDAYFPMQPFVLFGGAQNVQISINLPVAPTAVDAFSRYEMFFLGVIAQNSTPVS